VKSVSEKRLTVDGENEILRKDVVKISSLLDNQAQSQVQIQEGVNSRQDRITNLTLPIRSVHFDDVRSDNNNR